jgi:hypothetical protein
MTNLIRKLAPAAIAASAITMAAAAAPAAAEAATPLKGDAVGSFFFHGCPAGAPADALCLHDDVRGTLSRTGLTTGSFEVVFDLAAFVDGCGPIAKQGSFTSATGDRLDVEAAGTFCFNTLVAEYEFRVTGGSGRFAGATGGGSWVVPAPTTFDGVAGVGDEFIDGTIVEA